MHFLPDVYVTCDVYGGLGDRPRAGGRRRRRPRGGRGPAGGHREGAGELYGQVSGRFAETPAGEARATGEGCGVAMTSRTFSHVVALVSSGNYVFSRHALKEAAEDGLLAQDLVAGVSLGEAIEDYPDYHAGPCCLVFQRDPVGNPVHALWGLRKGTEEPAVLITCYRPDPNLWDETLRRRKT